MPIWQKGTAPTVAPKGTRMWANKGEQQRPAEAIF